MDIEDILDDYGVEHRAYGEDHHVSEGWLGLQCPQCGADSGVFHLGYNLEWKYLSCWQCGRMPLTKTLAELINEPYAKVKQMVGDLEERSFDKIPIRGKLVLPFGIGPLQKIHKMYLRERRFDPEALSKQWELEGIGPAPKRRFSLFIPIFLHNQMVSFTTRSVCKTARKRYDAAKTNEESVSAKSLLFGADHVRHTAIVCEGPFDVFRIGYGAVAVLGVDTTPEQLYRISQFPRRIVCFDNEKKAQQRADALCQELSKMGRGKTQRLILDAEDPGAASQKEINRVRRLFLGD
jgi:hypothetical protein